MINTRAPDGANKYLVYFDHFYFFLLQTMNRGMKASLIKEERSVSQDPPLNILLNTCLKNINITIILHIRKKKNEWIESAAKYV